MGILKAATVYVDGMEVGRVFKGDGMETYRIVHELILVASVRHTVVKGPSLF